jgi:pyruvate formate lyase activating enzyme
MNSLLIGGFEKQSLVDWEGKITAVIFTKGCNFRCSYCHNPDLVLPEKLHQMPNWDFKEILNFLNSRKAWLEGVVITGGEPTIHEELDQMIGEIKKNDFLVKLDTNGSNPSVIKRLINKKLIDYIALDVKTVLEPLKYQEICQSKDLEIVEKIKASIKIIQNSGIPFQLRTTIVPKYHNKEIIGKLKEDFKDCNYIQQTYRDNFITLAKYLEIEKKH